MITIMHDSLQLKQCDPWQQRNPKIDHEKPELHLTPIKSPWYHLGMDFVHALEHCFVHHLHVRWHYILSISSICDHY